MRLRAVRLSEVGHFGRGMALEGLSGAFDVLAGPNEMGKSTIFRAIETVFLYPHSSNHSVVKALAPAGGGAPLIEADFEAEGRAWRLRKRYLAARTAELTELGGGPTLRGADAEARLERLLAGRLGRSRMLGLLWVGQTKSLGLPDAAGEIGQGLGRLIEDEIANAAGEGLVRGAREAVAKALDGLISKSRGKPSAGKPYKAAIDARDQAAAALAKAEADAAAAERRLGDLSTARKRAEAIGSPEARAEREAQLARLQGALADADQAAEALKRADLQVAAREAARDQARERLHALDAAAQEAGRLRGFLADSDRLLADAECDEQEREGVRSAVQDRLGLARARAAELQASIEAHDLLERQASARARSEDLQRRLAAVRELCRRAAELDHASEAAPIEEALVVGLRRAAAEIDRLEARIAAARPRVRIDYATGAEGSLSVAGVAVPASGEIASDDNLRIDIEGVGRITITAPAALDDREASLLSEARGRMRAALRSAGVADIAAAEALLAAQKQRAAERQAISQRLAIEAPQGLQELERQCSAASVALEQSGQVTIAPPEPRTRLVGELTALRTVLDTLDTELRGAQDAVLRAATKRAELAASRTSAQQRLTELEARQATSAHSADEIEQARRRLAELEGLLNSALRERGAWQDAIPTPAARADLEAQIAAARRAAHLAEQQRQQIALDIRGLESALERDRQDGIEAACEEARAVFEQAQARVGAYEREVQELQLLDRLLEEEVRSARNQELRPVVERLQAYATHVLPGATFELGDKLEVSGLLRDGVTAAGSRLSGGTSEQIAVLVRLAYARLLADREEGLPLVLDDALVYADASRFKAMMRALAEAASHHQVIMLTCHPERIAALAAADGPNLFELAPWAPA